MTSVFSLWNGATQNASPVDLSQRTLFSNVRLQSSGKMIFSRFTQPFKKLMRCPYALVYIHWFERIFLKTISFNAVQPLNKGNLYSRMFSLNSIRWSLVHPTNASFSILVMDSGILYSVTSGKKYEKFERCVAVCGNGILSRFGLSIKHCDPICFAFGISIFLRLLHDEKAFFPMYSRFSVPLIFSRAEHP